jgi:hypothetical protein
MRVWYIQTVTDTICKLAVDVTKLDQFEESTVQVLLSLRMLKNLYTLSRNVNPHYTSKFQVIY